MNSKESEKIVRKMLLEHKDNDPDIVDLLLSKMKEEWNKQSREEITRDIKKELNAKYSRKFKLEANTQVRNFIYMGIAAAFLIGLYANQWTNVINDHANVRDAIVILSFILFAVVGLIYMESNNRKIKIDKD